MIYSYKIKIKGAEYPTNNDRVEWTDNNVKFARSKARSVVAEYVDNAQFIGTSRDFLLEVFSQFGYREDILLEVYKYDQGGTKAPALWNSYYFDYTTLKDTPYKLEIGLVDTSIRNKVEARADDEYEISVSSADLNALAYTGVSKYANNQIQCGAGKLIEQIDQGTHSYYSINGTRAARAYTANLQFADDNDNLNIYMVTKAIKTTHITVNLVIDGLQIVAEGVGWLPDQGELRLVKRSARSLISIEATIPSATYSDGNYRRDTFNYTGTHEVTLNKWEHLALMYYGEDNAALQTWGISPEISPGTGANTYMEIIDFTQSPYGTDSEYTMFGITHEKALELTLAEILGVGNFTLDFRVEFDFFDIIVSSQGLRGDTTPTHILSLKEIMESLMCFGASYDIQGSTFIVDYYTNFYESEENTTSTTYTPNALDDMDVISEVELTANTEDVYTSLKVGYEVANRDKENGAFAFNCINSFKLPSATLNKEGKDKALEIRNPFITDAYTIEDYLNRKQQDATEDNRSDNRNFLFACELDKYTEVQDAEGYSRAYVVNTFRPIDEIYTSGGMFEKKDYNSIGILQDCRLVIKYSTYATPISGDFLSSTPWTKIIKNGANIPESQQFFTVNDAGDYCSIDYRFELDVVAGDDINIAEFFYRDSNIAEAFLYLTSDRTIYTGEKPTLYRKYIGTPSGQFDPVTIYNLPLSPKRILLNNLPLISVSGWNRTGEQVEFISSERDADVSSQMQYEKEVVTENTDVDFVDPLFLPVNISFNSVHNYENFSNLVANKHKYFTVRDNDRNRYFYGWIKALDINVGMNQEQAVELILKAL